MNKKFLTFFACTLLLGGCSSVKNNEGTNILTQNIYSTDDQINIHGLLSEKKFDLSNYKFVSEDFSVKGKELEWSTNSDVVSIDGSIIKYNKVGYAIVTGKYSTYEYKVNVLINETEENRHLLKELKGDELQSYIIRDGNMSNVSISKDELTLDGFTSKSRVKVDYELPNGFNRDYVITTNVQFQAVTEGSRWTSVSFRSNKTTNKPYYQMVMRYNAAGESGLECAELTPNSTWAYCDTTSYTNNFNTEYKYQLRIEVKGWNAKFYVDENLVIDTPLNNLTDGNLGFQVDNAKVTYSNIKVFMNTDNITYTKDGIDSYVSDKLTNIPTLPRMAIGTASSAEIGELINDNLFTSVYLNVKTEKDNVIVTTMNGNKVIDLYKILPLIRSSLIPVIEVNDENSAKSVALIMNSLGYDDATIISSNEEALKTYRQYNLVNRIGYISSKTSFANFTEVANEAAIIGKIGGNIIVLDANNVNKQITEQFIQRGYSLWAISRDGSITSITNAVVNGALMIINENKEASLDIYSLLKSNALLRKPIITGHRGESTNRTDMKYPENSLESILYADEVGALAIEIDIYLTADNELVVIHDTNTSRVAACSLNVGQSTLAQLTACKLRAMDNSSTITNYTIPSFRDVLTAFQEKDTVLVVEIKDNLAATSLRAIEMIKEYNMMDRVVFIGFSTVSMQAAKNTAPEISTGYLSGVNLKTFNDYVNAERIYFNQGMGFSPNHGYLDIEGLINSNLRGRVYWAWTFYNDANILNKIKQGNLCFTTNYPASASKWNIDLLVNQTEFNTSINSTVNMNVKLRNYINEETSTTNYTIKVVSGTDVISVNGNQITGIKSGEAYVILEHNTILSSGLNTEAFTIYSDLIKITVA